MAKEKAKRKTGLDAPYKLSKELAAVVGTSGPLPLKDITSGLWAYIKKHKLQSTENKRVIEPNEKLAKVLGKKPIDMFAMQKKLKDHRTAV